MTHVVYGEAMASWRGCALKLCHTGGGGVYRSPGRPAQGRAFQILTSESTGPGRRSGCYVESQGTSGMTREKLLYLPSKDRRAARDARWDHRRCARRRDRGRTNSSRTSGRSVLPSNRPTTIPRTTGMLEVLWASRSEAMRKTTRRLALRTGTGEKRDGGRFRSVPFHGWRRFPSKMNF